MKQMKFASMDCIMDPDISPIKFTSLGGLRKAMRRFVTMRRLIDRRPDYHQSQLQQLFKDWCRLSQSKDLEDVKMLQRITTHGETHRITQEIQKRLNDDFASRSWKALRQGSKRSSFEMEIDTFDLVNCYMAQAAKEDWLQITMRCGNRRRNSPEEEWEKVVEYPVFEVRLTDGVTQQNDFPFIVVGVMRKDGTRYGKDQQDAAQLKKQFDKAGKWF
jgi:hypothetical protein